MSAAVRIHSVTVIMCGLIAACRTSSTPVVDARTNGMDSITSKEDLAPAGPDVVKLDMAAGGTDVKYPDSTVIGTEVALPRDDAGVADTQGDTAPSDSGPVACPSGMPANTAPAITETVVADQPPMPMGGTIEPGTYYETAWVRYNNLAMPPDAGKSNQHRQTAAIATVNGMLSMAISTTALDTGEPLEYYIELSFPSPNPYSDIRFGYICPLTGVWTNQYDAAPGTLTFYSVDTYGPYSWTLTKQ